MLPEPLYFAIDTTSNWLLVANEGSDLVSVMKIDPATGKLAATGESISVPKPDTLVFYAH